MSERNVCLLVEHLLSSGDPLANLQSLAALLDEYPETNAVTVGKNCVEFRLGAGRNCTEFELAPHGQEFELIERSFTGDRTSLGIVKNYIAAMTKAIQVHGEHRSAR